MNTILTAQEFFDKAIDENDEITSTELMIKFAKLHLEAIMQAIYDKGLIDITTWERNPFTGKGSEYLDLDKLKAVYPLTNIK